MSVKPIRLLLAFCFALLPSCAGPSGPNLLFITLDTTRADRLGCYGHGGAITPVLDSLAAEGVVFEACYTPAPVTLPAHVSMFTGLYPATHGVRDNGLYRLEDEALTLAEMLSDRGYDTGAVIGAYVLTSQYGLAQGFGFYDERLELDTDRPAAQISERRADKVTDRALGWLRSRDSAAPFALWVHYFDPHDPYRPPAPFDSLLPGSPYDGEIAFADRELGRLIAELRSSGQYANTVIVVAGDHGEALGEHGEPTHGIFLYNATVRVPLILRLPADSVDGMRVRRNVSLVDVMPTVLGALGADPPAGLQGQSLLPLLRGTGPGPSPERPLALETRLPYNSFGWSPVEATVRGSMKYIEAPRPELYDLSADPGELHDLAPLDSTALAREARRHALLAAELERESGASTGGRMELDAEASERLRALGYVSGTARAGGSGTDSGLPDPKRMIGVLGDFMKGVMAEAEGDHQRALDLFDSVLEQDPENLYALKFRGFLYTRMGRPGKAISQFRRAVGLSSESSTRFLLALSYLSLDSLGLAGHWLRQAIEVNPGHARAHAVLAEVCLRAGRPDSALFYMRRARELAPQDKEILNDLGKMLLDRGQTEMAADCFRGSLEADPSWPLALFNLGLAEYRLGNLRRARECLARVAEEFTGDEKVQNNYGVVLAAEGNSAEAMRAYERALDADSTYAPAWNNSGNLYSAGGELERAGECYRRAVRLDSTYADAWLNLGLLEHHRGGSPELAKRCLEQALALDARAAWAERARRVLGELGE